jgi:DNA mismatch repair protein MutL
VAFNFKHNQRQVFSLPVATSDENKLQRLTRLINKEFIQAAVQLNFEQAGLKLSGWLANGEYSRSQSDMQYFFVNGRMIRDKVITHAVRQVFQNTLYPGRFPVYVLNLEMDAEQVDVNVHPTKHEVRFRQGRLVHDFLFYSLREALAQEGNVELNSGLKETSNNFNSQSYAGSFNSGQSLSVAESFSAYPSSSYQNVANKEDINKPLGIAIAKLKNNYLLAQNQQGLLVLQLAQVRQYLIEEQIKSILNEQQKLVSKPVLIPFSLHLKTNSESWLEQYKDNLQQFGFEFAVLGEHEIMVRQIPAILNASDIKQSLNQFINIVEQNESGFLEALIIIILEDDFSNNPVDWNVLLRDLEDSGLEKIKVFYHQVSDKDLAGWFK